jgi:hypothetical protein
MKVSAKVLAAAPAIATRAAFFFGAILAWTAPASSQVAPAGDPPSAPAAAAGEEKASDSQTAKDPRDRLLEAELLEVASGDLDKALAVYYALAEDANAPGEVRARALLYTARCQRKLGKLAEAKEVLTRLVREHPGEREVLRQAQLFLRELESGKAANPDFDWIREIEKNPIIQERVFNLAMDLANPEGDEGKRAARQLLALGSVAAPIVEKLIETSRDRLHRHALAMVLVRMGRYEHVGHVLIPLDAPTPDDAVKRDSLGTYAMTVPSLPRDDRRRLLEALEKLPPDESTARSHQLLEIVARDAEELVADFASQKPRLAEHPEFLGRVRQAVESEPRLLRALADRILDAGWSPVLREQYFEYLSLWPEHLKAEHYLAHLRLITSKDPASENLSYPHRERFRSPRGSEFKPDRVNPLFAELEKRGAFDALVEVARGPLRHWLVGWYWEQHGFPAKAGAASGGWPMVLRAARDLRVTLPFPGKGRMDHKDLVDGFPLLHLLAEKNPEAAGAFADFLAKRRDEAPEYKGYGWRPPHQQPAELVPSRAYVEALLAFLDRSDDDPVAAAIALEACFHPASDGDEVLESRIDAAAARVAREAKDPILREFAIACQVRRFAHRPQVGPAAASALFEEFRRREGVQTLPEDYTGSPLFDVAWLGAADRRSGRPPRQGPAMPARPRARVAASVGVSGAQDGSPLHAAGWEPQLEGSMLERLEWTLLSGAEVRTRLYEPILAVADAPRGAAFHEWYSKRLDVGIPSVVEVVSAIIWQRVPSITDPAFRVSILAQIKNGKWTVRAEDVSVVNAFVGRAVTDHSVLRELREKLIVWASLYLEQFDWHTWFDWKAALASDDPLIEWIVTGDNSVPIRPGASRPISGVFADRLGALPRAERLDLCRAALQSPLSGVRANFVAELYPVDDPAMSEDFGKLFGDPKLGLEKPAEADPHIRRLALERIARLGDERPLPLLVVALRDPDAGVRAVAAQWLKPYAREEIVEPLTRLLDDPSNLVRTNALNSLKEIRSALAEKEEWQAFLRFRKGEGKASTAPKEPQR